MRRGRKVALLTALFVGTFMALLDMSVVNVSLPAIQLGLAAQLTQVQWVVDAYTLGLSAFMLNSGSLGDRLGRKRLFLSGVAAFTLASVGCATAPTAGVLIGGRLAQGIAAAAVTPGSLSLLTQIYRDPAGRARIIGAWGTCGSLAVVAGPVLGGVITDRLGWPAIFLLNVPLGVIVVVAGWWTIPESADPQHAGADLAGQVLGVVWLGALTYAVIDAGRRGWISLPVLALLVVAAAVLCAFVLVERRSAAAMLPVHLFSDRAFAVVNVASFVLGFGAYGVFYLQSLYLQQVQGASAIAAGLKFLPYTLAIATCSVLAGRVTARYGPRPPLLAGYTLIGTGLLAMLALTPRSSYLLVAVVFAVLGAGMGASITPTNAAAMGAVGRERSGIAAATVNATRQTGAALGIALLGSMLTARAGAVLTARLSAAGVPDPTSTMLAKAVVANHGHPDQPLGGLSPATVQRWFAESFITGLHLSLLVAAVATFAAVLLVAALFGTRHAGPPNVATPPTWTGWQPRGT